MHTIGAFELVEKINETTSVVQYFICKTVLKT